MGAGADHRRGVQAETTTGAGLPAGTAPQGEPTVDQEFQLPNQPKTGLLQTLEAIIANLTIELLDPDPGNQHQDKIPTQGVLSRMANIPQTQDPKAQITQTRVPKDPKAMPTQTQTKGSTTTVPKGPKATPVQTKGTTKSADQGADLKIDPTATIASKMDTITNNSDQGQTSDHPTPFKMKFCT